jgi:hypothetical protein
MNINPVNKGDNHKTKLRGASKKNENPPVALSKLYYKKKLLI